MFYSGQRDMLITGQTTAELHQHLYMASITWGGCIPYLHHLHNKA